MPLPSWLTDPPPIEADKCFGEPEKDDNIEDAHQDDEFEQQYLRRKGLLANPGFWEDLKKCRDVDDLHNFATGHGIDVQMCPKLLFERLCHAGQPLPTLLHALEDAVLGTSGNLSFLLDWQLRKWTGERKSRKDTELDDISLLQQWMRRQFYLGLRTEEDICVFLRFAFGVSDATSDESLLSTLIASIFEGLQSSSVFGFKDLRMETQCRLLESITRGPVTPQSVDLGFTLVEAMGKSHLEGTDQKISAFIGVVVHAHASSREHEKRETVFPEVLEKVLDMIKGLPQELACSVILITTKVFIHDHVRMPAIEAATMQLPDTWWSALAKTDILGFGRETALKTEIELFMSTQEPEVAVPYLRQLDDRQKACFILHYWVGPKTPSGRSRARYLFDGFCSAKGKDSPWISMFQAARKYAEESSEPSDAHIKQVFKVLQMLHQSETIVEIIKQARKLHAIIDESDVVYTIREHLCEQPLLAERLFHFYPRLRLEKCPELAERMILNPRIHPNTALHYMQKRRTRFPVDLEGFSQLRTQLLDRMALAYSSALHITPRMAFRNVHKCYIQHMKERIGAPSVEMARALTRAGLIRPLQGGQWVGTTIVRWILSVVRSTESTDVADRVDDLVYKWRGDNVRKFRAASLANRCAEFHATKDPMGFRVQIKWSKYYQGYEKVYTPLKIPGP